MKTENKDSMKQRKRNIKLLISYDGGNYHGFQRQNNSLAVQNILEKKLEILFGDTIEMAASGRTDAGVHAYGQVVNFFTDGTIPIDRVVRAANSLLPNDIVVKAADEVDFDFSARHSAISKIYIYRIQQGEIPDPFLRNYTWYIRSKLNLAAIQEALAYVVGEHDFSAFQATGSVPMLPIRTIYEATCEQKGSIIEFSFFGNGFLYHMVRNMVGTLVNVGIGKTTPIRFKEIMDGKDRKKAGATAPAQGLYLKQVNY